jgi:DNA-binding CsgD family transcriptional regulator
LKRIGQRDTQALVECVAGIYAIRDLDTFRDDVVRAVAKLVSADIITYTELGLRGQPTTRVVHPQGVVAVELEQIFEHYKGEHPLIEHFREHPQARVAKLSDFLTQRELRRLGIYNEFFRKIGVEHQIVIGLPASLPRVGGVAFSRSGSDFSERDRMVLSVLQPHIIQAQRNAESLHLARREATLVLAGLEEIGRGIVILRPDGGVSFATRLAREWLTTYFGHPALRASRLPEPLQRWAKLQEAPASRADDVLAARKPFVVDAEEARLIVRLIPAHGGSLLLLEQQQTVVKPAALEALGLSRREAEVLVWVTQGKTDAAIGEILSVSPRTVAKHLEHIYERLGVENRSAAAAIAFTTPTVAS